MKLNIDLDAIEINEWGDSIAEIVREELKQEIRREIQRALHNNPKIKEAVKLMEQKAMSELLRLTKAS